MATTTQSKRIPVSSLADPKIIGPAIGSSFRKLDPRVLIKNPVMFVVEVVAALTTILFLRDLAVGGENLGFTFQIILWLWFTILFANFAEAVAEGRGKAQADTLRRTRTETRAKRLTGDDKASYESVPGTSLKPGDVVLVEASEIIPSDGEVIEGVASVNETRLEAGAIAPNASPHDLGEIVGSALQRAARVLSHHEVEVDLAKDLPMLELDAVLFEQVLFNLLDNASKYAPEGTTIRVEGWRDGTAVYLQVVDEGEGIPPDDLERIFDKFYRAQKGDRVRAGTGLGLAISRGFVEAMAGTIAAANRTDRPGAVFTIRLPVPAQPRQLDTAA